MKFAKQAVRRKGFACCGSMRTIPWPPPPSSRKSTKKRKSRTRGWFGMKITRRVFVSLSLGATATVAVWPGWAAAEKAAGQYLAFVGTYTDKTSSKGIYAYRYD